VTLARRERSRATGREVVLAPADRLTLAFAAGLAVLALGNHPRPLPLVAVLLVLALAQLASARWATVSGCGRVVHDFFPVLCVPSMFNLAGPIIAVTNPARGDRRLAALDRELFGGVPSAWFNLLGRPSWLTDAASVAYVSYLVVPVVMAVALYAAGRRSDFEHFVFTVLTAFLLSYVGYFILPTTGPRVAVEDEPAVLGGGPLSAAARAFLRRVEGNQLDAFPSGHAALSLVYLVFGWRFFPRWRVAVVLAVAAIVFSTVYLSLHYVVDLVAGALLAALLPVVVPVLRGALAGRAEAAAQRPSSKGRHPLPAQPMRSNRPRR
jgi:membrane-associated phospholipid phosphatase